MRPAAKRPYPFRQHKITHDSISPCALNVCKELRARGFVAFVVGGAVRDLLLGKEPKDYDVATDATPEQVRDAFRRSRIIGRRFRVVHVMCGRETIEVTTFRGQASVAAIPISNQSFATMVAEAGIRRARLR